MLNPLKPPNHPLAALQIPYLLSLAGIIADYMPAFPFSEGPTIRLVDKIDQAFAILLSRRRDPMAPIAANSNDHLVSITDRVRIRSVIESTRIVAIETSARRNPLDDGQDISETFTDTDYDDSTSTDGHRQHRNLLNMSISKMYERSLSILGDSLG